MASCRHRRDRAGSVAPTSPCTPNPPYLTFERDALVGDDRGGRRLPLRGTCDSARGRRQKRREVTLPSVSVSRIDNCPCESGIERFACPCCGYLTLEATGGTAEY